MVKAHPAELSHSKVLVAHVNVRVNSASTITATPTSPKTVIATTTAV